MNESARKITLYVSKDANLPENIESFSLEDTFHMLEMGYFAIQHLKKEIYSQKNSEMMDKMKQELSEKYEKNIEELKNQISEAELLSTVMKNHLEMNVSERLRIQSTVYDSMLEKMKVENDQLREKMAEIEKDKGSISQQHIQMMDKIVNEKELRVAQREKEVDFMKATVDKYGELVDHLTKKRSTIELGTQGENTLEELLRSTFRDFEGFELTDVHNKARRGDFRMDFTAFSVLADAKQYSTLVPSTEREKIRGDLLRNESITFAWLVSMETDVYKYNRAPYMLEWVSSKQCICYVNSLMKQEKPSETLRALWYVCKFVRDMIIQGENVSGEQMVLKEKYAMIRENLIQYQKIAKERDRSVRELCEYHERQDEYIRKSLNDETNKLVNQYLGGVIAWWNRRLVHSETSQLKLSVIWTKYKKENNLSEDMDFNGFRDIVLTFVHDYTKTKGKEGCVIMTNVTWREDMSAKTNDVVMVANDQRKNRSNAGK
jgi:hypothetical protein